MWSGGQWSPFSLPQIPQRYQNSVEKGKFRDSAQNSAACEKLWARVIMLQILIHTPAYQQQPEDPSLSMLS